jgi:hypothetical protein
MVLSDANALLIGVLAQTWGLGAFFYSEIFSNELTTYVKESTSFCYPRASTSCGSIGSRSAVPRGLTTQSSISPPFFSAV